MPWANSGLKEAYMGAQLLCPPCPAHSPGTCAEVPVANISVITAGQQCRGGLIHDIQHPSPWGKVTAQVCDQLPTRRNKGRRERLSTWAIWHLGAPRRRGLREDMLSHWTSKQQHGPPLPQYPSPKLKLSGANAVALLITPACRLPAPSGAMNGSC